MLQTTRRWDRLAWAAFLMLSTTTIITVVTKVVGERIRFGTIQMSELSDSNPLKRDVSAVTAVGFDSAAAIPEARTDSTEMNPATPAADATDLDSTTQLDSDAGTAQPDPDFEPPARPGYLAQAGRGMFGNGGGNGMGNGNGRGNGNFGDNLFGNGNGRNGGGPGGQNGGGQGGVLINPMIQFGDRPSAPIAERLRAATQSIPAERNRFSD